MATESAYRQESKPDYAHLSRRLAIRAIAMGSPILHLTGTLSATAQTAKAGNPEKIWERFESPEVAGFRPSALKALQLVLYAKPTTSLMVVKAGKIAYIYGAIGHVSNILCVRKSILSLLYGRYVANGVIDLNKTVGELKIDEGGEGFAPNREDCHHSRSADE